MDSASDFDKRVRAIETRLAQTALRNAKAPPPREAAESLAKSVEADARWGLIAALHRPFGDFSNEDLATCFLADGEERGWTAAAERIATARPGDEGPRTVMRRTFATTLAAADARYAANRKLAVEHARALEVSCYKTTIAICQAAEDPPLRSWDNPAFLDAYSTRCGAIASILDPASAACRAYDAHIAKAMLVGEISPGVVGGLSESELCPGATAAERRTIASRSDQKVDEKESTMFACPFCHARSCTYSQIQCRSLDEAPDYKCICLKCGHRFTGRQ